MPGEIQSSLSECQYGGYPVAAVPAWKLKLWRGWVAKNGDARR